MAPGPLDLMNWVDLIIAIISLIVVLRAIKKGLFAEIFDLLGVFFAIYLSLQYFTRISDMLGKKMKAIAPLEFIDFLVYAALAAAGYLVFVIFRLALVKILKINIHPTLSRVGGFIIGFVGGFFAGCLALDPFYITVPLAIILGIILAATMYFI